MADSPLVEIGVKRREIAAIEQMITRVQPPPNDADEAISALLARLRRRIRAYLWADGLAGVAIALVAGFWGSLAIDRLFELPRALRAALLVAMIVVLGAVVFRQLIQRLRVRLADRNMALVLERRFHQFHDGLLTAVELRADAGRAARFSAAMLDHTRRNAVARAGQIDLRTVFNTAPLARRAGLAVVLLGAVAIFVVAAPEAVGIWARRNLLLSQELWPRATRLSVEGFDGQNHIKIARGSDWNLTVNADAARGRAIPEIVEVRYRTADGARGRENMRREGVVAAGQAPFQPYVHTFKSVLSPLDFYVYGGDDRQGPFHLEVVDSPTIGRMTLHCEYPAYMHRAPRDIAVAGLVPLPRGTQVTLRAESNKPLVSVQIDDVTDENSPQTHVLDIAGEHDGPRATFEYSLPPLEADKTMLFSLRDSDGILSRDPVRLALAAVPDEAPQVNVQLKGIGTAITSEARLPAAGEVSDDYGVAKVWFEVAVDDAPPSEQPLTAQAEGQERLSVDAALDARELHLEPKQKLHFAIRAADGCVLEGGPNVGASQSYLLDVVTPDQLRAMLEARELVLRRRFETIIEEFTDTRNLLASLPLESSKKPDKAPPAVPKEPGDTEVGEKLDEAARTVQLERVTQNSQRSAHESLEVALAFDELREEMINNRVDTEELKTRLKDGVADPLKQIVETSFVEFQAQLKQLAGQLADPTAAATTRAKTLVQADAILVQMKQVLDKMLELETFNEVLDALRQIIDAQEKLNGETKQKQRQKLRDLTE